MLSPQHVQVQTSDGLTLPGLLYSSPTSRKVTIYLHGNGSSSIFYREDARSEYAQELLKKDISFLALNNRGAHYIKRLYYADEAKGSALFGMAYEVIKECLYDINASINFLREKGFDEFYLAGESTGANKICVYDHYQKENPISAYVLLAGGDDVGIYYDQLGKETFWRILAEAKQRITEGKGEDLITELLPAEIFSYKGFYDMANPDGDYNVFPFYEILKQTKLSQKQPLFKMYQSIKKPTLTVFGEADEYVWGDVNKVIEILKTYNPRPTYIVISEADHEFTGHWEKVGKVMAEWLEKSI